MAWDLLLKERICSSRSKFFPLRVDSMSKSNIIKKKTQKKAGIHAVNITLFLENRQEAFIRGASLRLIQYLDRTDVLVQMGRCKSLLHTID